MENKSKFKHRFPIWFDVSQNEENKSRYLIETDLQGMRLIQALLEHYSWQLAAEHTTAGLNFDKHSKGDLS